MGQSDKLSPELLDAVVQVQAAIRRGMEDAVDRYMRQHSLKSKEFAELSGIRPTTLSSTLNGDLEWTVQKVAQACHAIGRDPFEVMQLGAELLRRERDQQQVEAYRRFQDDKSVAAVLALCATLPPSAQKEIRAGIAGANGERASS